MAQKTSVKKLFLNFKWSKGFRCPCCGHSKYCEIKSRKCFQCHNYHYQTSLLTGTIYEQTKLPLTVWFLAPYFITQAKSAILAMSLYCKLGVPIKTTPSLKHKFMQMMIEDERKYSLSGKISKWMMLSTQYLAIF